MHHARQTHPNTRTHTHAPTRVRLGGVGEVEDRALVEVEAEHAADVAAARVVAVLLGGGEDALHHALRQRLKLLVRSRPLEDL